MYLNRIYGVLKEKIKVVSHPIEFTALVNFEKKLSTFKQEKNYSLGTLHNEICNCLVNPKINTVFPSLILNSEVETNIMENCDTPEFYNFIDNVNNMRIINYFPMMGYENQQIFRENLFHYIDLLPKNIKNTYKENIILWLEMLDEVSQQITL